MASFKQDLSTVDLVKAAGMIDVNPRSKTGVGVHSAMFANYVLEHREQISDKTSQLNVLLKLVGDKCPLPLPKSCRGRSSVLSSQLRCWYNGVFVKETAPMPIFANTAGNRSRCT